MRRFFLNSVALAALATSCLQGGSTKIGEGLPGSTGGNANVDGGDASQACKNKPCGARCSDCDPNSGACLAVEKYCNAQGSCTTTFPTCESAQCQTSNDCLQPGAPCQQCPDGSFACPSVDCINGECVGSFPTCRGTSCQADTDCPQILAPCQQCPDGSVACPWSRCEAGTCVNGIDSCGSTDNPCEGKSCGESCHPCDGIEGCLGPPIVMQCDENQQCWTGAVSCSSGCKTDADCPGVGACPQCPDGVSCAELRCVTGACRFMCGDSGLCAAQGESCATGQTCCDGLECCAGVPIPEGQEYCSNNCPISDVNMKQHFASLDRQVILDKLAGLPISTWTYRTEQSTLRHIGPMAQDFMSTFEVGSSDKTILQVDADGVAFAAIQALYERLQHLERKNAELARELARIKNNPITTE